MTPEGRVKRKTDELLKLFKVWYFSPVSNGMGVHGIPDKICCVPVTVTRDMVGKTVGLFVAIENKAGDKDEPTERQRIQMRAIKRAGGIAVLVNETRLSILGQLLAVLTRSIDETRASSQRKKGARNRSA